jgi:hypothetical protein
MNISIYNRAKTIFLRIFHPDPAGPDIFYRSLLCCESQVEIVIGCG